VSTASLPAPAALQADADWWRQASVYQIYPRSFADGNGDGIGDLRGIISRVPYLQQLGVDAVWLSPFYPSALADGGYDVDDYRDVDPRIGTLDEFDEMVAALHDAGIRLIVDVVPNHSSDRHEWFQEALASPKGSNARERYIFRDGGGEDGEEPPADWTSIFSGPAWTRVPDGQWYLHSFATEQPDFNWKHPEVHEDFLRTLAFWSDRGVDGFRIDVAHGLAKDLSAELPSKAELKEMPKDGTHPLWDRDDVHAIYAEWRELFDSYDPPRIAVAEAWVETPERRAKYASPEGLGQAFNFDLMEADFDAAHFREIVTDNLAQSAVTGSSTTWVFSNHDGVRHATRYGLPPRAGREVKQGAEWVLAGGPEDGIDRALGLRPGGDAVRARAAGQRVPVPGRGARSARGRRDPRRTAPGPRLLAHHRRGPRLRRSGPRRLPGAAAVDPLGLVLRLRRGRRPPAAAGLVRGLLGRGRRGRARIDARDVPGGAAPAS
jgi:alpha-glucosidase